MKVSKLEELKKIYDEKHNIALKVRKEVKSEYENIIKNALIQSGFDMKFYGGVSCIDICKDTPKPDNLYWGHLNDFLRVTIKQDDDGYDISVYVDITNVEINNCCCGNWELGDWYYWYAKAMVIIAEHRDELVKYCQSIDRLPLQEDFRAECDFEKEEDRIERERQAKEKEERIKELDNATYICKLGSVRAWEDDYVKGANEQKKVVREVFKVIKRTPKFYIVSSLCQDDDNPNVWTYKDLFHIEDRMKRDCLYNIWNDYHAVDLSTITIKEEK